MTEHLIHTRIRESQQAKLNEIKEKLDISDTSETLRACIDITYNMFFEKEKYLINFYDIKSSMLLQWAKKGKENA